MIAHLRFSYMKAVLYSFFFNVAIGAVMFSYASFKIDDMDSYLLLLLICVVFSALYSNVKGNTSKPLLYNVVSLAAFLVFNIILALLIGSFNYGWVLLLVEWMENIAVGVYLLVVLIDSLTCLVKMKRRKG
jgi:hypothetical protein